MRTGRNSGFTLIEIMVVIVIVGILFSVMLPNMIRARHHAQLASCKQGIHNVATAMEQYHTYYHRYPGSLETLHTNNFIQPYHCPSNLSSYGLVVDGEKKSYTIYCNGIHYLIFGEEVAKGFPQWSGVSGHRDRN